MRSRVPLLLLALASLVLPACGGDGEVRALAPDTLAAWIAEGRPMVLLDTRLRNEFEKRHLPGAVAAEDRSVTQLRAVFPNDPQVPLIAYDSGGDDTQAQTLAREAVRVFGFPWVYVLTGGIAVYDDGMRQLEGNALTPPGAGGG